MRIGNWPLVMMAVEWIIRNPNLYDQSIYRTRFESTGGCGNSECCLPRGSYTARCVAGWIAFFARYRDIPRTDYVLMPDSDDQVLIETAALMAMDLDPEIYGRGGELVEGLYNQTTKDLTIHLFDWAMSWDDILGTLRDLMKADGVVPTPVILEEMLTKGVVTDEDVPSWI